MPPTLLREIPDDRTPARAVRKSAAEILERGGLVALPTETVYGLAARADDPNALERLREVKGRDADHAFTWHVADLTALDHFHHLEGIVRRIAERYWPGPLTLVLAGEPDGLEAIARDGWVGLRLPSHAGTRGVLEFVDFPVVMSSANRSGEPPLVDAPAVQAAFDGEVELVLDGGVAKLAESSTVLAVGPGRFEVLREGLITGDELRRAAGLRIAFVCTGNTCRSPMAEALARHALAARLEVAGPDDDSLGRFGFEISSGGVAAGLGSPASENAEKALRERGIDLGGHRSRPAIPEAIATFDRVYCLTRSHREALESMLPPGKARNVVLLDAGGRDVPDPIGGSLDVYRECADAIEGMIATRVDEWVD